MFLCVLQQFSCIASRFPCVSDQVVTTLYHTLDRTDYGDAAWYTLHPLRINCIIKVHHRTHRTLRRMIGKQYSKCDLRMLPLSLKNRPCRHTVKGSVLSNDKVFDCKLTDVPFHLRFQSIFQPLRRITVSNKKTAHIYTTPPTL